MTCRSMTSRSAKSIVEPQRQHRRRGLLSVVPDPPAADQYAPPSAAQRAAAQAYIRGEPIVGADLESAMCIVEQHFRKSDLARIAMARIQGEQSRIWDTMSRIIAVDLARVTARI